MLSRASLEIDEPKLKPQAPVCWRRLRAVDRFYVKQGRYPGLDDKFHEAADASRLADELGALGCKRPARAEAMNEALMDAHAQELSRFGASELHAVASVVGGVASQEAVKVIARQYEPVDHTYVFNGIAGAGVVRRGSGVFFLHAFRRDRPRIIGGASAGGALPVLPSRRARRWGVGGGGGGARRCDGRSRRRAAAAAAAAVAAGRSPPRWPLWRRRRRLRWFGDGTAFSLSTFDPSMITPDPLAT